MTYEQPYYYNSKEWIQMHGLDEYDSQARWYYPAIMRTTTMDPLCEKYYDISPYAWCGNNTINYVDPDGRDIWDIDQNGNIVTYTIDKNRDAFYVGVVDEQFAFGTAVLFRVSA